MTFPMAQRIKKVLPDSKSLQIMSLSTIINTFGNGLFFTIEIIFLTRSVGLSPHQVGFGFTIAALIAFPMSIPAGHFAHRINIRNWVTISQSFQGLVAAAFIFIHTFWVFLVLTIIVEITVAVTQTLRMVLINEIGGQGEGRVSFRAYLRAVTNLGIGLGTAFAGIALVVDTHTAYATLVVINGISFIVAALIFRKIPFSPNETLKVEEKKEPKFVALRDSKYVLAMILNGIYSMHFVIQGIGIPIWIINYTNAPRWTVSVVLLINTLACVLFSVRASKGTSAISYAAKTFFRAGLFVAGGCVLYAFAQGLNPWLATIFLISGMALHVTGELLGSAAGWGLGFGLARSEYQGQYQGVWQLSWSFGGIVGPALITSLIVDFNKLGWFIMAAVFALSTYLFIPLVASMKDRAPLANL
jgi:MFS family permease